MIPRPGVPDGDITGPTCRGLVFPDGDITGPNCRGLVFPDGDITGPDSQHGFGRVGTVGVWSFSRILHISCGVFWQPPSYFSQRPPSSFVVNGVSYSCAEQFKKARLFKNHRAVRLIMSSSDPSTRKRIGRSVRNVDSAAWDRERQNAVLSGNYAKLSQNTAMKHLLLSTDNKRFAEASPLDPVWGIGIRADDPRANDPRLWRGGNFAQ